MLHIGGVYMYIHIYATYTTTTATRSLPGHMPIVPSELTKVLRLLPGTAPAPPTAAGRRSLATTSAMYGRHWAGHT